MNTLFICYRDPFQKIPTGGDMVSGSNLKLLQKLLGEENVCEYYVHPYPSVSFTPVKWAKVLIDFVRNYYYGLSPQRVAQLVEKAKHYDSVFIDRSLFGIVAKQLRKANYRGSIITFFHNVETHYFAAKIGLRPWRPIVCRCTEQNDRWSCQYSTHTVVLNTRDETEIARRYNRKADFKLPVTLEDRFEGPPTTGATSTKPVCLFVGSYFTMNTEGILWFIREVFPHVSIRLQIIGKGMEALAGTFPTHPDIQLLGSVESLTPYYQQADFMILPIFNGSGMKVKTCEGLMYGKNILGTTEAFEGYDLEFDRVGGLCNTRKEFIDKLTEYTHHPLPRFNQYNRETYLNNYSHESREKVFKKLLNI